jgi:hypothetical protein
MKTVSVLAQKSSVVLKSLVLGLPEDSVLSVFYGEHKKLVSNVLKVFSMLSKSI